jgi:peptidoglycan/LPS O-acetylase OafA/YrhL
MTPDHRYRSLDSLRGVAATLVIFFHVNWNNDVTILHFFRQSFLFVDLFFILSGFIIATVYGRRIQTSSDAGRFMVRRFFRLYPLHLAALALLVAVETSKYAASTYGISTASDIFAFQRTVPAIFVNFAFLQGAGVLNTLSWNTPSWSISCEMIAYAAFALLASVGLFSSRFFWLSVVPIVVGYIYIIAHRGTLNVTFDIGTIRCLSGFFLGSLIARLPPAPFPNLLVAVSGSSTIIILSTLSGRAEALAIPMFAVLVYALRNDESQIAKLLLIKPLVLLGEISFSIYLVHYLVISLVGTILKIVLHAKPVLTGQWELSLLAVSSPVGDALVVFVVLCTIAIAKLSYEGIEKPGRALGYRLTTGGSSNGRTPAIVDSESRLPV